MPSRNDQEESFAYWDKVPTEISDSQIVLQGDGTVVKIECEGRFWIGFYCYPYDPEIDLNDRPANTVMSVSSAVEKIHLWVAECDQGHRYCSMSNEYLSSRRPRSSGAGLPTRLLEVKQTSDGLEVRLRHTKDIESTSIKYATLSYCWGSDNQTKCTRSNIHLYLESIPISLLPRTVRDALAIICDLDLQFLWVDAYCIIQGADGDWEAESSRMLTIYANSIINLAADAAFNADGGLIRQRPRNNLSFVDCKIKKTWRAKIHGMGAIMCSRIGEIGFLDEGQPLYRRGWAVQERLISPRTVHFGSQQLKWQCLESMRNEGSHRQTFESIYDYAIRSYLMGRNRDTSSPRREEVWENIILVYSRTLLTNPGDRLIAISGLAAKFAQAIGCDSSDYLAGLWRWNLIAGLTWSYIPHNSSKRACSEERYRAPSWSWASTEGEIYMKSLDWYRHFEAEIVDARCSPADRPFGLIGGGFVRIKAPIAKLNLIEDMKKISWSDYDYGLQQHVQLSFANGVGSSMLISPDNRSDNKILRDFSRNKQTSDLVFVVIGHQFPETDKYKDSKGPPRLRGLILEHTASQRGQYRRLGTFIAGSENDTEPLLSQARDTQLDELEYLEQHPDGRYIVEII